MDSIQEAADAAGVQAKLILSGKGDWRFLDIVAAGAGKLAALECAAFWCLTREIQTLPSMLDASLAPLQGLVMAACVWLHGSTRRQVPESDCRLA